MMISSIENDRKAGLSVALVALVVYANTLFNAFAWDDNNVILTNELLRGSPLQLFSSIDRTRDYELLPYYRPLTQLSFMLEGWLHGFEPLWMHLVNLLLHSSNTLFVYFLARRFYATSEVAFYAALFFALHPINTETVNFLSGGRNTMMATLFSLLALLLYLKAIERRSSVWSLVAGLALLAGLFSKEFSFMTIFLIIWFECRELKGQKNFYISSTRIFPVVIVVFFYLIMRWNTLSSFGIQNGLIPGMGADRLNWIYKMPGLMDRLLVNLYIIPRYLQSIIWPVRFNLRYEIPSDLSGHLIVLLIVWLLIAFFVFWVIIKGRNRLTILGLCWFVIFYVPVSGIFLFPSAPMSDRYIYLPAIGLWFIVADSCDRVLLFFKRNKYGSYSLVLILVILGIITFARNMDWKNNITLFSRFVSDYPEYAYSHAALGNAYYEAREKNVRYLELAEIELIKAIKINPVIPGVYTNLGNIRLLKGDHNGAIYYYTVALGIYPLDKEALLNRAITYEDIGMTEEAVKDFEKFLAIPGDELSDAKPYAESRIKALTTPY